MQNDLVDLNFKTQQNPYNIATPGVKLHFAPPNTMPGPQSVPPQQGAQPPPQPTTSQQWPGQRWYRAGSKVIWAAGGRRALLQWGPQGPQGQFTQQQNAAPAVPWSTNPLTIFVVCQQSRPNAFINASIRLSGVQSKGKRSERTANRLWDWNDV